MVRLLVHPVYIASVDTCSIAVGYAIHNAHSVGHYFTCACSYGMLSTLLQVNFSNYISHFMMFMP